MPYLENILFFELLYVYCTVYTPKTSCSSPIEVHIEEHLTIYIILGVPLFSMDYIPRILQGI